MWQETEWHSRKGNKLCIHHLYVCTTHNTQYTIHNMLPLLLGHNFCCPFYYVYTIAARELRMHSNFWRRATKNPKKKRNPAKEGEMAKRKQSPTKKNGIVKSIVQTHAQNTMRLHTHTHTQKDTHAHTQKHKTQKHAHTHAHTHAHKSLTLISNTQRPSHSLYPSPEYPATSTNTYSYT
jgi:hypothetical protein